jgi:hypothetical protein
MFEISNQGGFYAFHFYCCCILRICDRCFRSDFDQHVNEHQHINEHQHRYGHEPQIAFDRSFHAAERLACGVDRHFCCVTG